ncbi:MAG: hypothetical protein JWO31_355, partial [Phycisphaerales bacterium]|nr:hypothetical protein [Phycisphaerales bacterium]
AAAALDPADQKSKLEGHARQLVSQTFFGTLLKQMRESPFKSEMLEGGKGGQAFAGLFDQKMVDQMSRGAGGKLVNAILRKFEAPKAYAAQATGDVKPAAEARPADNRKQERAADPRATGAASARASVTRPARKGPGQFVRAAPGR